MVGWNWVGINHEHGTNPPLDLEPKADCNIENRSSDDCAGFPLTDQRPGCS